MAAIDDLTAAVAALQAEVTTVVAALGTTPTNDDAAVEAQTALVTEATASLAAAVPATPAP